MESFYFCKKKKKKNPENKPWNFIPLDSNPLQHHRKMNI